MELADGDFVKNISGHLSQTNIIEYLVMMSSNSIIGRFGVAKPTQKQFNFDIDEDEVPMCMYGSLITVKDSKSELSYIEQLGFEISRDKNFEKEMKLIWFDQLVLIGDLWLENYWVQLWATILIVAEPLGKDWVYSQF